MVNYGVLVVVFLNCLIVQAQRSTGNVLPKAYSALPQEPVTVVSKSATANCGCTRVLTFDDIVNGSNTHFGLIPYGYGGLNWVNGYYMNTTWELATYGWNGFYTGRNSGNFVAFNGGGEEMSMSVPFGQYFQLNSLVLSSAWNNNLTVTIKGTRTNVTYYQTVVTLQVTSKTTLYTLKWSGIDRITFSSTGGTPYPGVHGLGTQFVLDDIDISI